MSSNPTSSIVLPEDTARPRSSDEGACGDESGIAPSGASTADAPDPGQAGNDAETAHVLAGESGGEVRDAPVPCDENAQGGVLREEQLSRVAGGYRTPIF